ncbi:phosphotransferase [Pseudonocardia eucalypti]|uniref:Phosphotransferase n=1 Tax=Pseudonocardia eucalypti TaxID=648755 RepID=A0ABP9PIZ6_9PSEU|nr:thiamine kinase-like enzyme [Pseudonocardia eucalypti]
MGSRLELAALTGRIAYHVAKERLTKPRPVNLRQVPPTPEAITDEWLTLALCDDVPGARVVGHELGKRDDGTSSRRWLTVQYNEAGKDLPYRFFTKSGPNFKTRLVSAAAGLSRIEANFYALVRPQLEIEAPPTRYSAYDPISNRQMLIVDDIAATLGAEFGTILTRKLTREMAEGVVDTLAALHVKFWGAPLQRMYGSWLWNSYDFMATLNVTIGATKRIMSGFDRGRHVIPARLYDRRHEVPAALMRSLEINISGPQTMLHSDVHPGNWYVTKDGAMGLCDWQCVVQGGWARDLAYALSSGLTPEDRREWEKDLVARHGQRLAEAGIEPPSPEEAFLAYRQQMPHAMFMWLGTLGRHPLQPDYQPRDIVMETVRRVCTAADDLETLDALKA